MQPAYPVARPSSASAPIQRMAQAGWRVSCASLAEASSSGDGDDEARLRQTQALGQALAQARPSMAAIANTVAHIWWAGVAQAGAAAAQLAAMRAEALRVDAGWDAASQG